MAQQCWTRMISVEIRAPDLTLVPHWDALARRAAANVFLHPAALCAAAAAGFAVMHVLLAWEGETLVGLVGAARAALRRFFPRSWRRRPTSMPSSRAR